MPNKCKQFGSGFQSEGFALHVRTPRSIALPHGYYFLFYWFLRAPRIRVFPPTLLPTDTHGILRADAHNVIVKAFYISMPEKNSGRYLQIRGRALLKSRCKNYRCDAHTCARSIAPLSVLSRAIRSGGSLNVSAYNGDRKFGSR